MREALQNQSIVGTFLSLLANDTPAAVELLHPEVQWRNTGLPTLKGQRVTKALLDMDKRGIGIEIETHHLAGSGDTVLTDRTDTITFRRFRSSFWVRGTFRVEDGLIVLWDDAFGWGSFLGASALGVGRLLRGN
ncbi:limonene-1,2-epoxide hydrolase family protein [Nocardioides sp.]|uniref:limonene-1,2-epoxide hydrolase family protein n=1 Tax=Nocardioides sp. TaxID=35761 RepID=UPI003564040D